MRCPAQLFIFLTCMLARGLRTPQVTATQFSPLKSSTRNLETRYLLASGLASLRSCNSRGKNPVISLVNVIKTRKAYESRSPLTARIISPRGRYGSVFLLALSRQVSRFKRHSTRLTSQPSSAMWIADHRVIGPHLARGVNASIRVNFLRVSLPRFRRFSN
jgi:hypothetical protein